MENEKLNNSKIDDDKNNIEQKNTINDSIAVNNIINSISDKDKNINEIKTIEKDNLSNNNNNTNKTINENKKSILLKRKLFLLSLWISLSPA